LPIAPAAVHVKPDGSRQAIKHFTEYLGRLPDDLEVRWLLNLAHMTLGEYPHGVDPAYLVPLDRWLKSEFDIGRFRDVGDRARVNRHNQAGGASMEDFDGDGLLDLAVTAFDPTERMAFYHNKGDGAFEERTESAGVANQLGGLYCVQADYNNDGRMDLFVPRGAWLPHAIRPTLLRNDGGTFSDVTEMTNLMFSVNSNSACWADYDNDGLVDLFVCCEQQDNRLYHNLGDAGFEEVAVKARLKLPGQPFSKGAAWIDYDNDRYPDLFFNTLNGPSHLFHNNRDGTFTEVTQEMGIDGPREGFSCWAWDYDNDGWLDVFATCYDRSLKDVVKGLMGEPHARYSNRLFRNRNGKGFEDATKDAGLDMVFATMGSNFADFDNDGFLDFYLATGEPSLATLIPNRMFRNVDGSKFEDVTVSTGTGHLQKGHGVSFADHDFDGDLDLFVQTGGQTPADKAHNVLFENGVKGRHWANVKLEGRKSNRSAIGATVKATISAADGTSRTIHRVVGQNSSFGGNSLALHLGLDQADKIAELVVRWPNAGRTEERFENVAADRFLRIVEGSGRIEELPVSKLPDPK